MNKYFINGIGCVSAQDTSNEDLNFSDYTELNQGVVSVLKPNYFDAFKKQKPTQIIELFKKNALENNKND